MRPLLARPVPRLLLAVALVLVLAVAGFAVVTRSDVTWTVATTGAVLVLVGR